MHQESVLDLDTIEAHRGRATADRAPEMPLRAMPDDAAEDDWPARRGLPPADARHPGPGRGCDPMPYDGLRAVMKEPWQVMVGSPPSRSVMRRSGP